VAFDIGAYLDRIGYSGELVATQGVLEALHLAHATRIPFENLDILLGRAIHLDLESLQTKLVRNRRGGYCFEHNILFGSLLEHIGFRVRRLAARVRVRGPQMLPRTHMTLLVEVDGKRWLADVGFGGEGLLRPVPFDSAQPSVQFHWTYRVVPREESWILQSLRDGTWIDLYGFGLEAQEQIDYEMANYYTSTHPSSRFVQTLTAQKTTPERRTVLRNRELTVDAGAAARPARDSPSANDLCEIPERLTTSAAQAPPSR
jgi:N-hydroxyarylamine O-acetyltransferase